MAKDNTLQQFLKDSEKNGFSDAHRKRLRFNIGKCLNKVEQGKMQFANLEKARQLAHNIKAYSIEHMPRLLLEFEKRLSAKGGKVIWAENTAEALQAIQEIAKQKNATSVVKSKSMITEEIGLNHFLESLDIKVLETDLGEFIVQLRGEPPYHIVTPAMHLSKEDIAQLFHEKYALSEKATPEEITAYVRDLLRQQFVNADIGITGGNFLVADTGSVVLVTNEGNARLATTIPKTHIAIVGIEKIIPSINHLDVFLPLLSTYGTGQKMTVYNTILNGPKQTKESDGPEEMYVILLDNGRSDMVADEKLRESLYCIRCGSCLNNCPVYNAIGGHTYNSPYSGPIGSVISPHLNSNQETDYSHLNHASSLCGNCTENCPVKINIHELLLYNRHLLKKNSTKDTLTWAAWQKAMLRRSWMNAPLFTKSFFAKRFLSPLWGKRRAFPDFPKQTFNQLWKNGKI